MGTKMAKMSPAAPLQGFGKDGRTQVCLKHWKDEDVKEIAHWWKSQVESDNKDAAFNHHEPPKVWKGEVGPRDAWRAGFYEDFGLGTKVPWGKRERYELSGMIHKDPLAPVAQKNPTTIKPPPMRPHYCH